MAESKVQKLKKKVKRDLITLGIVAGVVIAGCIAAAVTIGGGAPMVVAGLGLAVSSLTIIGTVVDAVRLKRAKAIEAKNSSNPGKELAPSATAVKTQDRQNVTTKNVTQKNVVQKNVVKNPSKDDGLSM